MSYLADIKMPEKEEEIEIRDPETGEVDPNFIYDDEEVADDGVEEEQDPLPPPPEKKVKLKKEDIFKPKSAPAKKVAPAPAPEPVDAPLEPIVPKIAPVQKKKRVMSEAQKEALKKGREKRMANKKKQTPKKETVKPPSPVPVKNEVQQPQATQIYYDKDELAELVFQGVQRYDNMRKERKEKKKKSQAQANHDQKVFKDINNAISRQSDPWGDCFR